MKFIAMAFAMLPLVSHPTRGAWIEIRRTPTTPGCQLVAPHTGCVD